MKIKLNYDFSLTRANVKDFAIHYTTYRENIFFRQSWERRIAIFGDDTPSYWLLLNGRRIGGVCLEPNTLWAFFIEPPFTDIYLVLTWLKKYMIEISDSTKPINAVGILPYQSEHFLRLGFQPIETRRIMIRPTEKFDRIDWETDFVIKKPTSECLEEIAQLSYKAYLGPDSIGHPTINTIEQQRLELEDYFNYNKEELLQQSSCLVFDQTNNKLVGACLISIWEDLPLVYNIVVDQNYRGKGIASNLIKHALTILKDKYEVIRLFVTVGNAAESLYYNFGFLPGIEQITYGLPCKE